MSGRSTKRWTSSGEAARVLREKFITGEIDPRNLNADEVYNSHAAFMQFEGKTFKANLARLATSINQAGGIEGWVTSNQGKHD